LSVNSTELATERHILFRRDQRAKRMGCSRSLRRRGQQACALIDVALWTAAGRRTNCPAGRERVGEEPVNDSKTQREQRLAAALRANLRRRKQQARKSAEGDAPRDPADTSRAAPDTGGSDSKT
jgi:hypothetical protein